MPDLHNRPVLLLLLLLLLLLALRTIEEARGNRPLTRSRGGLKEQ
jgi:hypothetical protein